MQLSKFSILFFVLVYSYETPWYEKKNHKSTTQYAHVSKQK